MHPKSVTHNLRDFNQFFTATSNKVDKFWLGAAVAFNIFMFPALVGSYGIPKWKQMASFLAERYFECNSSGKPAPYWPNHYIS